MEFCYWLFNREFKALAMKISIFYTCIAFIKNNTSVCLSQQLKHKGKGDSSLFNWRSMPSLKGEIIWYYWKIADIFQNSSQTPHGQIS